MSDRGSGSSESAAGEGSPGVSSVGSRSIAHYLDKGRKKVMKVIHDDYRENPR